MTQLAFDATTHTYRAGNQLLPSVTQIISAQGLGPDYSAVPPATLMRKAITGTKVHGKCQMVLQHGPRIMETWTHEEDALSNRYVDGFVRFLADTHYEQLGGEQPLADLDLGIAGTLDSYGWLNGWCIVVDFKTAISLHLKAAALQVHAYSLLLKATGALGWRAGDPTPHIEGYYALQLKPGAYKLVDVHRPGVHQVWLAAIEEFYGRGTPDTAEVLAEWRER